MKTTKSLIRDAPARLARCVLVSVALTALSAGYSIQAYERLQGPTELLFCNKEKALNGYTLFGVGNRTFLLDLAGQVMYVASRVKDIPDNRLPDRVCAAVYSPVRAQSSCDAGA